MEAEVDGASSAKGLVSANVPLVASTSATIARSLVDSLRHSTSVARPKPALTSTWTRVRSRPLIRPRVRARRTSINRTDSESPHTPGLDASIVQAGTHAGAAPARTVRRAVDAAGDAT